MPQPTDALDAQSAESMAVTDTERTAAREWRHGWLAILAATIGIATAQIHFLTMGLFIKPITQSLNWQSSDVTVGFLISSMIGIPGGPLAGWVAEKIGVRPVILIGLPCYLVAYTCFGVLSHTHLQWTLAWVLIGLCGLPLKPNIWMLWIGRKFDLARGMAFAVIVSGAGLFSVFLPYVTQVLIERFGWRLSFGVIAAILAVVTIPVCMLALRPARHDAAQPIPLPLAPSAEDERAYPGLGLAQVVRMRQFWQICLLAFLLGGALFSLQVHLVGMFEAKRLDARSAAFIAGLFGGAAIVGRLVAGALLDRVSARLIGCVSLLVPATACLLYLTVPVDLHMGMALSIMLGIGVGVEGDVLGYIASRHFGLRKFGTVFGLTAAATSAGSGVGPVAMSFMRDRFGSYDYVVQLVMVLLLLAIVTIATLGRYPDQFAAK